MIYRHANSANANILSSHCKNILYTFSAEIKFLLSLFLLSNIQLFSQKSAINYLQSAEHKMNVIAANSDRHLSPQMMRNKPTNLH